MQTISTLSGRQEGRVLMARQWEWKGDCSLAQGPGVQDATAVR